MSKAEAYTILMIPLLLSLGINSRPYSNDIPFLPVAETACEKNCNQLSWSTIARNPEAHPSQALLDIQDPEVLASVSDPRLNMQGLTSISYPSQAPEMEKGNFTMLPTM